MNSDQTVSMPFAKLASAWAAVGITSWAEFASFLAAIYTVILLAEWVYKKFFRHSKSKERTGGQLNLEVCGPCENYVAPDRTKAS